MPEDLNFDYTVDGKPVVPGTYLADGATVVIKGTQSRTSSSRRAASSRWTFTFTKVGCPPEVVFNPKGEIFVQCVKEPNATQAELLLDNSGSNQEVTYHLIGVHRCGRRERALLLHGAGG